MEGTVVRRCAEGERLFWEWAAAMETHDPEIIRHAMKEYFDHKNCPECRVCGPEWKGKTRQWGLVVIGD